MKLFLPHLRVLFALTGLLSALSYTSVYAQPNQLSLSDAIRTSLQNNFDLQIQQENIRIAEISNNWGEAGRWPTINLTLGQGNASRSVENPAAFLQGTTLSNNLTPGAQINWVLFDGFRVVATKRRFEDLQKETEGNAAVVVQNTLQSLIMGYYRVALEKQRIDVFRRTLNVSKDKYDYLLLKKEIGSAVTTEVLFEEENYLADSIALLTQEQTYRNAVRDLNVLMAIDNPDQEYNLTDTLKATAPEYRLDDLLEKMNQNNVNLRQLYLSQAVLKDNVDIARSDLYPRVTFNLNFSYDQSRQDLSNARFAVANPNRPLLISAQTTSTVADFGVAFTLFNGGRIKRAIRTATAQYDLTNLRVEQLKLSLERDMLSALDLYNIRRQLKGIAARRKEAAEKNLVLSLEQFRLGTVNSFDYRIVQLNYLNAAMNDIQATFNLIESEIALLRLTGGIVDEYGQ